MIRPSLQFAYNFFGNHDDVLCIHIVNELGVMDIDIQPYNDGAWQKKCVTLTPSINTVVTFRARRGQNDTVMSAWGIDDVSIVDGDCFGEFVNNIGKLIQENHYVFL